MATLQIAFVSISCSCVVVGVEHAAGRVAPQKTNLFTMQNVACDGKWGARVQHFKHD